MDKHEEQQDRINRAHEFEDELIQQARFEPGSQHWPLKTRKVVSEEDNNKDDGMLHYAEV